MAKDLEASMIESSQETRNSFNEADAQSETCGKCCKCCQRCCSKYFQSKSAKFALITNILWFLVAVALFIYFFFYWVPVSMAHFASNSMKNSKGSKMVFKLNPDFDVSKKVLKQPKLFFTWEAHRKYCRQQTEKNGNQGFQVIENKILTMQMLKSTQFNNYVQDMYGTNTEELMSLLPKRYYELQIPTKGKIDIKAKKFQFISNQCNQILDDTGKFFVYKATHLTGNGGVNFMSNDKWIKENWTCEKLWEKLEGLLTQTMGADSAVAKDEKTGEPLNPGFVIEKRFPKFDGCTKEFVVGEIKVILLWGKVVIAKDACNKYRTVFRFKDGTFDDRTFKSDSVDYNIQASVDVHWDKIVKWSEIIASYIGADRMRIDWFHKYDQVQFNELAYPGKLGFDVYNKMLSDILYDGYNNRAYQIRNTTNLL